MSERLTELDVLEIIRIGFSMDDSPCTAEKLQQILEDDGCRIPLYRLKRNLFMLVHTGKLAYNVHTKEFYGDPMP